MPLLHAECYLPSQNHIVSGLLHLHEKLQRSITNQSWRISVQYFRQGGTPSECLKFLPARHMQGHLVSWPFWYQHMKLTSGIDMEAYTPVSAGLSTLEGKDWAKNICLPSALLSGTLSIMHLHSTQQVYRQERSWMHGQGKIALPCKMHWSIGRQCIQTY